MTDAREDRSHVPPRMPGMHRHPSANVGVVRGWLTMILSQAWASSETTLPPGTGVARLINAARNKPGDVTGTGPTGFQTPGW